MVAPAAPGLCSQHVHPAPTVPTPGSLHVFSARDGRVSENTVCLIRKLLVLDPQQRLTASEVLDSLSSIIASWYVLGRDRTSCLWPRVVLFQLWLAHLATGGSGNCRKPLNPVCPQHSVLMDTAGEACANACGHPSGITLGLGEGG